MINLIILILSATGLTMILCKSTLFRPVRVYISEIVLRKEQDKLIYGKNSSFLFLLQWLDAILSCPMCNSVYTGSISASIIYLSYSYPLVIYILYPFMVTPVVTLVVQQYSKIERGL